MKALLISSNQCTDPYPVYPLGMSIIARVLTDAGWEVVQSDILVHGLAGIEKKLEETHFDLIGISIRNIDTVNSTSGSTTFVGIVPELVKLCRAHTKAPIHLGGAGFSLFPEEFLRLSGADFGIVGEGENGIYKLLDMLQKGEKTPKVIREGRSVQKPALYDEEILDYYYRKTHIVSMQTKRGCPFHCVYCTYPALEGRRIRAREQDPIWNQISEYHEKYPDALFFFVDAIFNDRAGEYRTFLREMKRHCGKIPYSCFITPEALTMEDIDLLHETGLALADIGLDATSDATLKGMGKGFSFRQALECVERMRELDIGLSCSVMVGGPGETYETLEEGIANLHKLEPTIVGVFSGVRILSGTPLYAVAQQRNMIPPGWNGLTPLYFFEKGLDENKVHERLFSEFKDNRSILYPPDRMNSLLRKIHKIGYLQFREYMGKGRK
ncbi:MAG: cobalamin-dependent protein [Lentisphaeria bacterium]|nr:cobalamin-dependent protein [Lentisphaeria bacterium]